MNYTILVTLVLCFLLGNSVSGQIHKTSLIDDKKTESPYEINTERTITLVAMGLVGRFGGEAIVRNFAQTKQWAVTEDYLALLDPNDINAFDRGATRQYSLSARKASDLIRSGTFALPLFLLFDKKMNSKWKDIVVIGTETYLLTAGITTFSKALFQRKRPIAYNPDVPLEEKLTSNTKLSFFSGHTSVTATMTFMTAKFFADFNPDSPLKPYFYGAAGLITSSVAYFRYKGGKHFPTDVLTGAGVGALIGILIPQSHKKKKVFDGKAQLSFVGEAGQVGFILNW